MSLAQFKCAECGATIQRRADAKSPQFCNRSCLAKHIWRTKRTKSKEYIVQCTECGATLRRMPWAMKYKTHFCNRVCQGRYLGRSSSGRPRLEVDLSNHVQTECTHCGKPIVRQPHFKRSFPNRRYFCCKACQYAWQREHWQDTWKDESLGKADAVGSKVGIVI